MAAFEMHGPATSSATVTSRGRVTIPVKGRVVLGVHAGSRLALALNSAGTYEIRVEGASIRHLNGIVRAPVASASLATMDDAIGAAAVDAP